MSTTIRRARTEDAPSLHTLELLDDHELPAGDALVAEQDGEIAGFCSITAPSRDDDGGDRTCEVAAIYVEPAHWRRGVGSALLIAALQEVRAARWEEVTLWVFAENEAARAFYGRFGFEPDGAQTRHERSGQTEVRLRARLRA